MYLKNKGFAIGNDKNRAALFAIFLAIVLCIVYFALAPVLDSKVRYFDDEQYFYKNELVKSPSFASAWTFLREILLPSTVRGYYQPLAMISLMLDVGFGASETNLTVFHMTSLIIHLLNVALVTVILFMLFKKPIISAIGGLLYGLHPTAIESIVWISERKTVLATLFVLISLLLYIIYIRKEKKRFFWISVATFLLSLLSKPTTIGYPIILIIIDWWLLNRSSKKTILENLPYFELSAASALITFISQKYTASAVSPLDNGFLRSFLLVLYNISFYVNKIFVPINQSGFYCFPEPFTLMNPDVAIHAAETILILVTVIVTLKWTKSVLAGFGIFIIAIFPTLGIIGFTPVIAADRFIYFPIIGFILTFAYLVSTFYDRLVAQTDKRHHFLRVAAALLSFAIISFEAYGAHNYTAYWKDTETIYKRNYSIQPDSYYSCFNLGSHLLSIERYDEGEFYINKALDLQPEAVDAYIALGTSYRQRNEIDKAIEQYKKAYEINPKGIGRIYMQIMGQIVATDSEEITD